MNIYDSASDNDAREEINGRDKLMMLATCSASR